MTGAKLCRVGTGGPLCAVCQKGWYHSSLVNECTSCKDATTSFFQNRVLWIFGGVGSLIGTILLFYKRERLECCLGQRRMNRLRQLQLDFQFLWNTSALLGKLKVLFVTYQIIGSTNVTLGTITFPAAFTGIRNVLESFTKFEWVDGIPVMCADPTYNAYKKVLFVALVPLALVGVLFLAFAIQSRLKPRNREIYKQYYGFLFLLASYILLPTMSVVLFGMFECDYFEGGSLMFLTSDASIECGTTRHLLFKLFAATFILSPVGGPVGFPLMCYYLLKQHRLDLAEPEGRTLTVKLAARRRNKKLAPLRFLFDVYKPSCWWYECFNCLVRVSLSGILTTIDDVNLRCATGVLVAVTSLAVQNSLQPYHDRLTNALATSCQVALFLVFLMGLLLNNGLHVTFGVTVVLVGAVAATLAVTVYGHLYEVARLSKVMPPPSIHPEWAVDWKQTKFKTTMDTVRDHHVANESILVWAFCTVADAQDTIGGRNRGLRTRPEGLVFSMIGPDDEEFRDQDTNERLRDVYLSSEIALAVVLPRNLLRPGRGEKSLVLHESLLTAVNALKEEESPRLPVSNIIRAFQLVEKPTFSKSDPKPDEKTKNDARRTPKVVALKIDELKDVTVFLKKMEAIRVEAERNEEVVVFHFTNGVSAGFIVKTGLRMSTQGQGDGGVYFITMGPISFKLGTEDFERLIIESCFGKERMHEYLGKNMLSHVIVATIDPKALSQVPGGRHNAFAVSKRTFETLATPNQDDGAFYLPLERIKACFRIHTDCTPCEDAKSSEKDVEADRATQALLVQMTRKPKPLCIRIEPASTFSKEKFRTTIQFIKDGVGPGDVLVYYYTSHVMADKVLRGEVEGLPALKHHGGVRFAVFGPQVNRFSAKT